MSNIFEDMLFEQLTRFFVLLYFAISCLEKQKKNHQLEFEDFSGKKRKVFSLNTEWPHLHRQVVILTRRTKKLFFFFLFV
jgi:hypothetical protein